MADASPFGLAEGVFIAYQEPLSRLQQWDRLQLLGFFNQLIHWHGLLLLGHDDFRVERCKTRPPHSLPSNLRIDDVNVRFAGLEDLNETSIRKRSDSGFCRPICYSHSGGHCCIAHDNAVCSTVQPAGEEVQNGQACRVLQPKLPHLLMDFLVNLQPALLLAASIFTFSRKCYIGHFDDVFLNFNSPIIHLKRSKPAVSTAFLSSNCTTLCNLDHLCFYTVVLLKPNTGAAYRRPGW